MTGAMIDLDSLCEERKPRPRRSEKEGDSGKAAVGGSMRDLLVWSISYA